MSNEIGMMKSKARPPRLFVFVWFIAAVGVLAGGLLLRAMGWSEAMGLADDTELKITSIMCAVMIGVGIGEWRGMNYAKHVRERAELSGRGHE